MASLLRRSAFNLTRSLVPKSWIPASRPQLFNANRSYIPTPVTRYQERLKANLTIMPGAHSLLFTKVGGKELVMRVPGLEVEKAESSRLLRVSLKVDGAIDVIARIDGNHLLIECMSADGVTSYQAGMKMPFTCNGKRGLKGVMVKDGKLTVTLPTGRFRLAAFLSNFLLVTILRLFNYHEYCFFAEAWFRFSHLRRKEIPSISAPNGPIRSFTNYKKKPADAAGSIYLKLSRGKLEQVESTSEGLCVSVKMPGFKIEDVTFSFENKNALVIQGKTETEQYLAAFHIPDGYETEIGNIKTEMHQGVYKATLPRKLKETIV